MLKTNLAFFKLEFNQAIQYRASALVGVLTQIAWGLMYIFLYSSFMNNSVGSTDMTIEQMSTYIWLQQGFLMLINIWRIDPKIFADIKTGNVSMQLVRPIKLYKMWYYSVLGNKVARTLLRCIPLLIFASLPFLGQMRFMFQTDPFLLTTSIVSLVLTCLMNVAYTLIVIDLVFITHDETTIRQVFNIILQFLSGLIIPLQFMPEWMLSILKFTPFYYSTNLSFNIYSGYYNDPKEILMGIGIQILWLIGFLVLGNVLLKTKMKRVTVLGG
jgi:ABC-2 type transport system permease protein